MAYLYPLGVMAAAAVTLPKVFSAINNGRYPVTYVKSTTGDEVLVRDLPDKKAAADRLIEIRRRCFLLRDVVIKNFPDDPRTRRLIANLDQHTIFTEATPDSS